MAGNQVQSEEERGGGRGRRKLEANESEVFTAEPHKRFRICIDTEPAGECIHWGSKRGRLKGRKPVKQTPAARILKWRLWVLPMEWSDPAFFAAPKMRSEIVCMFFFLQTLCRCEPKPIVQTCRTGACLLGRSVGFWWRMRGARISITRSRRGARVRRLARYVPMRTVGEITNRNCTCFCAARGIAFSVAASRVLPPLDTPNPYQLGFRCNGSAR